MAERGVLCPVCKKNLKYWSAKACWECAKRARVKNSDSRFFKNRKKNPLYEKFLCPICKTNYMSKNSKRCLECHRKDQRKGRGGEQHCVDCGVVLNDSNWPNNRRKWWHRICNKCFNIRKSKKDSSIKNRKSIEINIKLKEDVMAAYGGKCQCCGEQEIAFLTIDHVHENGKTHYFISKTGKKYRLNGGLLYRWLRDNGYPQGEFQCLCMNCNFAKSKNPGGCPHQMTEDQKRKNAERLPSYDYTCDKCGKQFRSNGGIASHKRKYHPVVRQQA